ncbi:tRNA threonylcarbamoyladenosine dehydratase [Syntrophomonas palmitatica]|uniref:tRNA threonylcarbamoyladenosine dehydratase n=1 Tax=Syntrophomonas palmitatica TaxID=402877 RepID=UPI0006D135B7|nr:tRNA threonylcarbamoyladenosine dehydratase [Syntrophomonas palmitatica]
MTIEFSRTESLLGQKNMQVLADSRVAVFGLGGVGSYAAEALARTGVGHLVLVDHDSICLTNINRQIHATHKTVGQPKVTVMQARIAEINPQAQVEVFQTFFSRECADELIRTDYNYIIDAIDTVSSKIELIIHAQNKNIPIVSSMGTGNKLDPSRLEIADIYETSVCPLARVMRRELKKRGVGALTVVYSREEPLVMPTSRDSDCNSGCVCTPDSIGINTPRRQLPGSISFVPSVAGLLMAGKVVRDLLDR